MQKNRIQYYTLLCLCLMLNIVLLTGCGQSKKEIRSQYVESVTPIMTALEEEAKKWEELQVKESNGEISGIQTVLVIERSLLPNLLKLQKRMEDIKPNEKLHDIHEIGIKMISKNAQAYNEISAAVHNNDMSKITSASQLMSEARELERTYVRKLEDFAK